MKQQKFHEAGKTHRRRFFFGANQSGKSTAGAHEALGHVYGYRFWEIPDLALNKDGDLPHRDMIPPEFWIRRADGIPLQVPNFGVITTGLPRFQGIGENIWPVIQRAIPQKLRNSRQLFNVVKGAQGVPVSLNFPNGSHLIFGGEEQDDFAFEGFVADWWWCDEPVRQAIFNAMQARLMANMGPMWFTLTPLGARSAWMLPYYRGEHSDTFVLRVVQSDNPAMTEDKRRAFADGGQWTDRERAARIEGEFEVMEDRVFESYNPDVHLIEPFVPPKEWIRGVTVDPHHKRPAFMVWWYFDPDAKVYYFSDEWPNEDFFRMRAGGKTPTEYATIIRNIEGRRPATVRICDPRFGKAEHMRHGYKETCWADQMAELGLFFDANVPNVGGLDYGHAAIIDLLYYDKDFPLSPTNQPRIKIFTTCKNLDRAFRNYSYLDVKDPIKGLYKKVSEEYKDPIDGVRYTVLYPIPLTADQAAKLQRWTAEELERENDY